MDINGNLVNKKKVKTKVVNECKDMSLLKYFDAICTPFTLKKKDVEAKSEPVVNVSVCNGKSKKKLKDPEITDRELASYFDAVQLNEKSHKDDEQRVVSSAIPINNNNIRPKRSRRSKSRREGDKISLIDVSRITLF